MYGSQNANTRRREPTHRETVVEQSRDTMPTNVAFNSLHGWNVQQEKLAKEVKAEDLASKVRKSIAQTGEL